MKPVYERPTMNVENFAANEFIAACGDSNVVYKFKCTAGGGKHGDVFEDVNKNGVLDKADVNLTPGRNHYYHACGKTHEAPTDEEFPMGFFVQNGGNDKLKSSGIFGQKYDVIPVRIWTNHNTNVHATTDLDINEWQTAKS